MYILTFKSNKGDNFGSIGVFKTSQQITDRINNSNNGINDYKYIDYKDNKKIKQIKELNTFIKDNARQYCSFNIIGANNTYNVRIQDNLTYID